MSSDYSSSAALQGVEPQIREERFEFTATGSEYFRIWIVNLLLTVVTVGIYSAWAKVRRNQYFYANTRLAGGGFEYHARPMAILKGRAIAGILFGTYNAALHLSPVAGLCMLAVLMAVMPWLIWKSHQFALYNSSYRGIRFGFGGSAKGAYFHYLALPLLCVLTLGLLYPFVHQRIKRFQHTHGRYGNVPFSFDATPGHFYKYYLLMLGGAVVLPAGVSALLFSVVPQSDLLVRGAIVLFLALVVYPYVLSALAVFMALLQNLVWNHTQLGGHRFRSAMRARRIAFIYFTNALAIIFTLGLYTPFAKVRALRYRLECISLAVNGSLDDIAAGQRAEIGAVGDGAADLGGFDLGL
jgi:uncharacterized membrane protein YjgN (DUF898 family)